MHQPVLEQSQSFVRPDPHQTLNRQGLQWLQGLIDSPHPAGHFPRTVDVMRLHVLCESVLKGGKGVEGEGKEEGGREGGRGEGGGGGEERRGGEGGREGGEGGEGRGEMG